MDKVKLEDKTKEKEKEKSKVEVKKEPPAASKRTFFSAASVKESTSKAASPSPAHSPASEEESEKPTVSQVEPSDCVDDLTFCPLARCQEEIFYWDTAGQDQGGVDTTTTACSVSQGEGEGQRGDPRNECEEACYPL